MLRFVAELCRSRKLASALLSSALPDAWYAIFDFWAYDVAGFPSFILNLVSMLLHVQFPADHMLVASQCRIVGLLACMPRSIAAVRICYRLALAAKGHSQLYLSLCVPSLLTCSDLANGLQAS